LQERPGAIESHGADPAGRQGRQVMARPARQVENGVAGPKPEDLDGEGGFTGPCIGVAMCIEIEVVGAEGPIGPFASCGTPRAFIG
jgi:hypothetical protein